MCNGSWLSGYRFESGRIERGRLECALIGERRHATARCRAQGRIDLGEDQARLDAGFGYSTDTQFRANASWRNVDVDGRGTQLAIDARLEQDLSNLAVRLTAAPNADGWIDGVRGEVERTDISKLVTETAVAGVRRQSVDVRDNWTFGAAYYFDRQAPQAGESAQEFAP